MEIFLGSFLAIRQEFEGSLRKNYEKCRIEITKKMQKLRIALGKNQY